MTEGGRRRTEWRSQKLGDGVRNAGKRRDEAGRRRRNHGSGEPCHEGDGQNGLATGTGAGKVAAMSPLCFSSDRPAGSPARGRLRFPPR